MKDPDQTCTPDLVIPPQRAPGLNSKTCCSCLSSQMCLLMLKDLLIVWAQGRGDQQRQSIPVFPSYWPPTVCQALVLGVVDTRAKMTCLWLPLWTWVSIPRKHNYQHCLHVCYRIYWLCGFSLYICLGDLTSNVNLSKGFGSPDFGLGRLGFDFLSWYHSPLQWLQTF